jgi:hypothetical protein
MRTLLRWSVPALAVLAVVVWGPRFLTAADKPKYTIEEIMEQAHDEDNGLFKKVLEDKASKDDKAKLLELYKDLSLNKPKKGDAKSWKEKTSALVAAATAVVAEDKGAKEKLMKAANCVGCHKLHK